MSPCHIIVQMCYLKALQNQVKTARRVSNPTPRTHLIPTQHNSTQLNPIQPNASEPNSTQLNSILAKPMQGTHTRRSVRFPLQGVSV